MADVLTYRQALLSNLLEDVSPYMQDDNLCDKDDPTSDVRSVACKLLLESLFKKWPEDSKRAEDRALLTFLEANSLSERWAKPPECRISGDFAEFFGEFRSEVHNFFHFDPAGRYPIDLDDGTIAASGRVGPGAARRANCTSFYGKMACSPLTATSLGLYTIYRRYVESDPRWLEMETSRESHYGSLHIVSGSKVSFAPKNADIARLICTEPSVNMYLQLGLCALLEDRMREIWNVSLDDQPDLNRLLARRGSLGDGFATLDLSSASDSVSVALCKEVLPGWVYDLVMELRSPTAEATDYGLNVKLGCISTMGNGFTFPLMTMLLSCAVRAVYRVLGIPLQENRRYSAEGYNVPGNWAVFGDDIIARSDAYDNLVGFLQSLGFRVNVAKSFNKGPFRESCGHDYFLGKSVRGVYLKGLTSRQDLFVAVNRLNDWSYRTGVGLPRAVQYLMSLIRDVLYVPYAETEDAGVKVPSSIFAGVSNDRKFGPFKACYKRSVARAERIPIGDGAVMHMSGSKRLKFNGAGALLSFLLGEVRDGSIVVRANTNNGRYQTRWHVSPNWDYMPPSAWVSPRVDWPRWETAVYDNLKS
jgi:hypothetical protein